ncbi:hypothetical protein ID867_19605 [Streptomyces parvulus]|nr:hypothetical protein [Streptomyces parvulus]
MNTTARRPSCTRCTAAGHQRMLPWVVEGTARARRFHERAVSPRRRGRGAHGPASALRRRSPLSGDERQRAYAAWASAGWARASVSTGAARSSPSAPSPSMQASATRRYGSCGRSRRRNVVIRAGAASGARSSTSSRTG